jgi:hypothetical protein
MLARPFKIDNLETKVANVYLEKIAKRITDYAVDGAVAAGRTAAKGVKAFGNQVHLSIGGAYMDHAEKLGVKSPYKLADNVNVRTLYRTSKKVNVGRGASAEAIKAHRQKFFNKTVPELQRKQRNARITVGAITGATGYGAYKAKEKLNEPTVESYNYY